MLGRGDLDRAVSDGVLSRQQADALWARRGATAPGVTPSVTGPAAPGRLQAAALAGSVLAGAGAAWLLLTAGERLGAPALVVVALACGAGAAAGARALERRGLAAGGVLAAIAVAMVPAAAAGLQRALGLFSEVSSSPAPSAVLAGPAFPSAAVAVVAAIVALRAFRAPILSAVVVGAVWFLVMLAAPLVFGAGPSWSQRALLSALLGVVVLGAGVALDGRTRRDHAGWLYLSGLVAFCGAFATVRLESTLALALEAAVDAALVFAAVALRRKVFAIFGALGLASVLGQILAVSVDDAFLPLAFGAVGVAAAAGAFGYLRLAPALEVAAAALLPDGLRRLLPPAPGG